MDTHARSLLERLNTSASPKPLKPSSIPDSLMASASSAAVVVQNAPSSPSARLLTKQANIGESQDAISFKDLLDSARLRSRETSHASLEHVEFNSTEPSAATTSSPSITTKIDQDGPPHLSDGGSSGNADEIFETPTAGSNNSSIVSNAEDSPGTKSGSEGQAPPQGCCIPQNVSALITLSPMKPELPRLQMGNDSNGRPFTGDGIEQIAILARTFGVYDREIIGATNKYIVYALKDGRIRIIDQNTGTRAIAETPSAAPVISISIRDGSDGEESFLLVLDSVHDLTVWSIKPWKIDSADVPLDYLIRLQTSGRRADQSYPPIAKWWPRYSNCLAVCTGVAVRIYVLADKQHGQQMDISTGGNEAVCIPVETGIRDFCFSTDGSTLAVIDYHGDILMWALNSDPAFAEFYKTSLLNSKLTLPKHMLTFVCPLDWNPCSLQFLDLGANQPFTPLLLVGCNYNRRLHTVDITEGVVLQEIALPSDKAMEMPAQNFAVAYTKEEQFLTVGDTLSSSIYFLHLDAHPVKTEIATSQSEYLTIVAERKITENSTVGPRSLFDYVTELPFFPKHSLQTIAVTQSHDALLDVFIAHSNGFSILLPTLGDLLPANYKDARSFFSRPLQTCHLQRKVDGGTSDAGACSHIRQPVCDDALRPRERSSQRRKQNSAYGSQNPSHGVERRPTIGHVSEHEAMTPEMEPLDRVRSSLGATSTSSTIHLSEPHGQTSKESATAGTLHGENEIETFIARALEEHYRRMSNHQNDLTAAADERHEAILKVVASTLTSNVGKVLEQVVRSTIEKSVLPAINSNFKKSMDQQLAKSVSSQIEKTIPKELQSSVSDAIQRSLFENDAGANLPDTISTAIVAKLEGTLQKDLASRLGMMFDKMLEPLVNKLEERWQSLVDKASHRMLTEMRASQQQMAQKIDALTEAVAKLSEHAKAAEEEKSPRRSRAPPTASSFTSSRREDMIEQFKAGKYSAGIEIWSEASDGEQEALFEVCLAYQPAILDRVEQLTLMTAANSISIDLKSRLDQRLTWLEKLVSLARKEGRYTEYWPKVLALLDERLEAAFVDVSSKVAMSAVCRKIAITQYNVQKKLEEFNATQAANP